MLPRLLREPTLHFFALAALALVAQRLFWGDARSIALTPTAQADLLRRYQDQLNRAPTSAEAEAWIAAWKADEVLYREALREGIDREDPAVRNLLVGKMRERLLLQTRLPEPTEADLQRYLERHRDQFEEPNLYEHEYVTFSKQQLGAEQARDQAASQLEAGATPASLGLRSVAANVNRERIEQEFGPELAEKIVQLPLGHWQKLETSDRWIVVKLMQVQGGLPAPQVLRSLLASGWKAEAAQRALDKATQALAGRYRFEDKAP